MRFFLIFSSTAWAIDVTVDEESVDFGEKYAFSTVDRNVEIWNRSSAPVSLKSLSQESPLQFDQSIVGPGKSTKIRISAQLKNSLGAFVRIFPFEVASAGQSPEKHQIRLAGYVESILDDPKPVADFGVIAKTDNITERVFRFENSGSAVGINRILEKPDFLEVRIIDGKEAAIKPFRSDVLGFHKGILKLALDSNLQSEVWITALANVEGDIVPDQNPADFGVQREGARHPIRVQLASKSHKVFRVGAVSSDPSNHISLTETSCIPKPSGDCHAYELNINSDHPHGRIYGKVSFKLPESHEELNVHLGGMLFADGLKIQSLNEPLNGESVHQTQTPAVANVAKSIQKAVSQEPDYTPPGEGPLLKWKVANEGAIYGYAIFRGLSPDEEFKRVNAPIVAAENKGDNSEATYQYRDTSAEPGKEYWYYITIFYNSGKKVQLTGPQKVVAK